MAPVSYVYPPQMEYMDEPVSRTYQYRKVMKPMLERKRRARINRCLDELKELMVAALHSEGENLSKLEKADILELTVRHLHNLRRQQRLTLNPEQTYVDRFRAGFIHCAQEVSHFLTTPVELVDPVTGAKLLQHLSSCIRRMDAVRIENVQHVPSRAYTPPTSPNTYVPVPVQKPVWRPW